MVAYGWAHDELSEIDLPDKRLNKRVKRIVEELAEAPMSSINQACRGWADTKAAYRLFDNSRVQPETIFQAHRDRARERLVATSSRVALAIEDTTSLNFSGRKATEGLGSIRSKEAPRAKGLLAHTTLLATPDGLPLGVFDQAVYARKTGRDRKELSRLPIEQKESHRWLRPLSTLREWTPDGVRAVLVADREADIYELLAACNAEGLSFLIRSNFDRACVDDHGDWYSISEALEREAPLGCSAVEVRNESTGRDRVARLAIKALRIKLRGATRGGRDHGPLEVTVVEAKEATSRTPRKAQPIHWRLLTDMPVKDLEQALERVNWYKCRWLIEQFHRVLKGGCRVEEVRLMKVDRLRRALAVYSIVAWRLLWMSRINRLTAGAACSVSFEESEWKALYVLTTRERTLPRRPPPLDEVMRWMARLGGFLDRKGDRDPGIETIWRGWQQLRGASETYALMTCG